MTRFRADPTRVRTALRPLRAGHGHGDRWVVMVDARDGTRGVQRIGSDPRATMLEALTVAEEIGLPGIDLDMGWAYEHPWGELRAEIRGT